LKQSPLQDGVMDMVLAWDNTENQFRQATSVLLLFEQHSLTLPTEMEADQVAAADMAGTGRIVATVVVVGAVVEGMEEVEADMPVAAVATGEEEEEDGVAIAMLETTTTVTVATAGLVVEAATMMTTGEEDLVPATCLLEATMIGMITQAPQEVGMVVPQVLVLGMARHLPGHHQLPTLMGCLQVHHPLYLQR
jgi:hypothetical protein